MKIKEELKTLSVYLVILSISGMLYGATELNEYIVFFSFVMFLLSWCFFWYISK